MGVTFLSLPVKYILYLHNYQAFPKTLRYHPAFFKNIEMHKPFASDVFEVISVNSMKITDKLLFIKGYFLVNI